MQYTDNIGLRKPETTDYYNIENDNANADLIDAALKANADAAATADGKAVDAQTDAYTANGKVDNTFSIDIEAYYGNTKLVDDFQTESGWSGVSIAKDITNVKIGKQSIRLSDSDDSAGTINFQKSGYSLDLSKLNNGEDITTNDYILFTFYVSGLSYLSDVGLYFAIDTEFTGYYGLLFNQASLVEGWNFKLIKISSYGSGIGDADWASIDVIRIRYTTLAGAYTAGAYMSPQLVQFVKKDPEEDYLNPFQRFNTRDFAIINGVWFVGKEKNEIVIKNLECNDSDIGLVGTRPFTDFTGYGEITKDHTASDYEKIFYLYKEPGVYLFVDVNYSEIRLVSKVDGLTNVVYGKTLNTYFGDVISAKVVKHGLLVKVYIYYNGSLHDELSLTLNSDITNAFLTVYNTIMRPVLLNSLSITNINHAHHSIIAEAAESLAEQAKCKIATDGLQSIPNEDPTAILFEGTIKDNRLHWSSDEPTKIYVRKTGYYDTLAKARFVTNTSGIRRIYIYKNGSVEIVRTFNPVTSYGTDIEVSLQDIYLKAGDYIEVYVYQSSGAPLNLDDTNLKDYNSLTLSKRP